MPEYKGVIYEEKDGNFSFNYQGHAVTKKSEQGIKSAITQAKKAADKKKETPKAEKPPEAEKPTPDEKPEEKKAEPTKQAGKATIRLVSEAMAKMPETKVCGVCFKNGEAEVSSDEAAALIAKYPKQFSYPSRG